ncbi:MAG TPA: hypothetical protein VE053_06380 [Allosphingosinicella sp.]|nr:hypothetical protein [Allosphingosinicella sp.]
MAIVATIVLILAYIAAYGIATAAIAPLLPGLTGGPVVYPQSSLKPTPSGVTVTVPQTAGEHFGRGLAIGLTAVLNLLVLGVIPISGTWLGGWAFGLISLGAFVAVARNRFYQGFLGWSAWLFPISYVATAVGLLLFVVNLPFSFGALGPNAFRVDWTTGVITSADGILAFVNNNIFPAADGFSLGNFVFLHAAPGPDAFTEPGVPSHETGHSLNTGLMGGIVLWINAVDENIWPARANLAYGELMAEGHSQAMPGPVDDDYALPLWF